MSMCVCECFCLFVELTHLKAKVYDMFYFFAAVLGDVCYLTETSCGRFPEKPLTEKKDIAVGHICGELGEHG